MLKVGFEKAQHIPEGLEGHLHAEGYVHTQRVLISSLYLIPMDNQCQQEVMAHPQHTTETLGKGWQTS